MTREEEIEKAIYDYSKKLEKKMNGFDYFNHEHIEHAFIDGIEWADSNPKSPWIKFTEKIPPRQEQIIIAMRNKNKEDGIWLYDLCKFFGGDYTDNNNWEEKVNWEIPIYWMPILNLPKE